MLPRLFAHFNRTLQDPYTGRTQHGVATLGRATPHQKSDGMIGGACSPDRKRCGCNVVRIAQLATGRLDLLQENLHAASGR
jgi:hypothetical protein